MLKLFLIDTKDTLYRNKGSSFLDIQVFLWYRLDQFYLSDILWLYHFTCYYVIYISLRKNVTTTYGYKTEQLQAWMRNLKIHPNLI